jgi:hypothetical protein
MTFMGRVRFRSRDRSTTGSRTATDPIPVLLERAGDIAVNEGEIAEAIANAEARNTASTVPPSM